MDEISYERWKDFSYRMARTCYADHVRPDLEWILREINHFFDCLSPVDVATFQSWDQSGLYARETGYFDDRSRVCGCRWSEPPPRAPCPVHRARSRAYAAGLKYDAARSYAEWSEPGESCTCDPTSRSYRRPPLPDCPECGGDPHWRPMANGPYVCDIMSEQSWDAMPAAPYCRFCDRPDSWVAARTGARAGLDPDAARSYGDWREVAPPWWRCECDEVEYEFQEAWLDQWFGPVNCCIRAGIDFAADPSAGVLGFTAGDVRAMFPEGVPEWVFPKGQRLYHAFSGEVNGTFEELPDSAGVML